jgi:hypothetical protein
VEFIYTVSGLALDGRTNGGGEHQVLGRCVGVEGGGIKGACLVTPHPTSPLEGIFELFGQLPIEACEELTRRLLTSVSSLPPGVARPRALLKTVIFFVAEYGSTP